ncbi:hypothetical protein M1K46_08865 [Fictibacillus sp. WQ 8-8]|uniref:hypothetical protein n=1 Tax=Fictibacillus sp. WQ 8-8 TaxID=2938788 RepID=UPI0006A788CA|nr:hypothetical protein [Fictibacillus sp. WQ 8-8]MCQ6265778.1 hypothetical protein [Fictibacillus sp. WQ 8-8]SFD87268.1 hypothetical protein SAMN05428981_102100 [Bacillus sp. OV194]
MPRRKLLVPGVDSMLNQYREEIGEEFGIYRPAAERDFTEKKPDRKKEKSNGRKETKSRGE